MKQLLKSIQLTQFTPSTKNRYFSLLLTSSPKCLQPRVEPRFIISSRSCNFITWSNKSSLYRQPNQVTSRYYSTLFESTITMAPTMSPSSTICDISSNNNTSSNIMDQNKSIARSLNTTAVNLGSKLPPIPSKEIKFSVSWGHIAAQVSCRSITA